MKQKEMENGPPVWTLGMKVQHNALKGVHLDEEDNLNKNKKTDS